MIMYATKKTAIRDTATAARTTDDGRLKSDQKVWSFATDGLVTGVSVACAGAAAVSGCRFSGGGAAAVDPETGTDSGDKGEFCQTMCASEAGCVAATEADTSGRRMSTGI
jgi:hypothetical protein